MKYSKALLVILLILILDQMLKIYIKTNFRLYETRNMIGNWFQLHFIENNGMAFGLEIMEGSTGKLILSIFRLIAVILGILYLKKITSKLSNYLFAISLSLIIAGAAGNLLDSIFYGMIFTESTFHTVSHFTEFGHGYAPLFQGRVVDMLYFPLTEWDWPMWLPIIGGRHFLFFAPIFNLADFSISCGAFIILIFQKRMFHAANS